VEVVREVVILVVLKELIQVFQQSHQQVVVMGVVVFLHLPQLVDQEVPQEVEVVDPVVQFQEEQVMIHQQTLHKEQVVETLPSQFMLVVEVAEPFVPVRMQVPVDLLDQVE
tara:strand:+ start:213 stop:545 length:333 start_codon:yes stop_codon:yes gene_type:complete